MAHEIKLPWLTRAAPLRHVPKNEWGPRGWAWLHGQAINYQTHPSGADRAAMLARFWSFIRTLPCLECRTHAANYARTYPPDFSGSAGFQTWVWRFHNAVNYRLGKPCMTAEDYRREYAEEIAANYWQYVG